MHSILEKKRAELAGIVDGLNEQLMQARADLVHVDATMAIFGYGNDPTMIRPRRKADRLFARNEMQRLLLDLLQASRGGMNTANLTTAIVESKGWDADDKVLFTRIMHRVNTVMARLTKAGRIQRGETDGQFRIWHIAD